MTAVVLSLAASVVVFVAVGQVLVAQWQVSTSRSLAARPIWTNGTTSPAHSPTPMSPMVYSRGSPQSV